MTLKYIRFKVKALKDGMTDPFVVEGRSRLDLQSVKVQGMNRC